MSSHENGIKQYLIIFGWLAAITVLEIVAVMIHMPRTALIIFVLGTAIAKAVIIAVFFMHLKSENPMIWWVPGVPIVLALFFIFMLFPDMVYHLTLQITAKG